MEPDETPQHSSPSPGLALLPLAIFAVCLAYFGWRYWDSGDHIYGLLALLNALGLLTMALGRRRR